MKQILFSLLLSITLASFAQETKETELKNITFTELIHQLIKPGDSIYTLKNTFVKFDSEAKEKYGLYGYRFENKNYPEDTLHINKKIQFENVYFEESKNVHQYGFINLYFHHPVNLKNTYNLYFFNCVFDKDFNYKDYSEKNQKNILWLSDSEFNAGFYINSFNNKADFNFEKNIFNEEKKGNNDNCLINPLIFIGISNADHFAFSTNRILYKNNTFAFQLLDINTVFIHQNQIESEKWNLLNLKEIENLSFTINNITADLIFYIDKIQPNYEIHWPITSKKIFSFNYLYQNQKKIKTVNNQIFDSIYDNRAKDELFYKAELSLYSKFLSYFKDLHNRKETNQVYIEIKNIETRRLAYLYEKDKNFENFFELWVNRFIKYFSNYGTSPAKIVSSSFKVILFFAFLFIFSSNSWSNFNIKTINKRIKQSLNYFTSHDSFVHSFELYNEQIEEIEKLKSNITNNKRKMPKTFSIFSKLILSIQNKLAHTKLSVLQYFDIVKNRWTELPHKKKLTANLIIFISIVFYFIFKVLSILLNALMLSINSFTTLGFGEIPIKGIGRYLAILEGFIGWLFLTLFSVTLISQILY